MCNRIQLQHKILQTKERNLVLYERYTDSTTERCVDSKSIGRQLLLAKKNCLSLIALTDSKIQISEPTKVSE